MRDTSKIQNKKESKKGAGEDTLKVRQKCSEIENKGLRLA